MSLLPRLTAADPSNFLFATTAQLQSISSSLSTVNISTATGAGVTVSEPVANSFVFTNALSNAGGISFVSVPGSSRLGLSNAGVLSVTAGSNVTVTGTAGAPVINAASAPLSPNVVRDQFSTSPADTNTPAGGAVTVAATVTGLTVGKVYMVSVMGEIAGGPSGGVMGVGLTFPGVADEQVMVYQSLNTGNTLGISSSPCFIMPTTSFNVIVYGLSVGGDTITFSQEGIVVTQLN